jgi:ComF family protein
MCYSSIKRPEKNICLHCQVDLPKTNYHQYEDNELAQRFWGKVPLKYSWAYLKFTKQGKVQKALHKLKYGGQPLIGEQLGRWYGNDLRESGYQTEFDVIVPVPLHPDKLKKRGYNQSDTFASGLSQSLQIRWSADILLRSVANETQTRKKRMERWENVKEVFVIAAKESVADKRVLLVDDVVTTGATLEACVRVLLESGCPEVSIAAIASA